MAEPGEDVEHLTLPGGEQSHTHTHTRTPADAAARPAWTADAHATPSTHSDASVSTDAAYEAAPAPPGDAPSGPPSSSTSTHTHTHASDATAAEDATDSAYSPSQQRVGGADQAGVSRSPGSGESSDPLQFLDDDEEVRVHTDTHTHTHERTDARTPPRESSRMDVASLFGSSPSALSESDASDIENAASPSGMLAPFHVHTHTHTHAHTPAGGAADDDDASSPTPSFALTQASTWRHASASLSARLSHAFLSLDAPQLVSFMSEHWAGSDAALAGLMAVMTRPVHVEMHSGAGAMGQHAVAVESAIALATKVAARRAVSGHTHGGVAALTYEPYALMHLVEASPAGDSAGSTLLRSTQAVPGSVTSDSDDALSAAGPEADAISGAVIAAHGAAFEAAVADVYHTCSAVTRHWHALYPDDSVHSVSRDIASAASPLRPGAAAAAAEEHSMDDVLSSTASRPVSCLFPRQREEVEALQAMLARTERLRADAAANGGSTASLDALPSVDLLHRRCTEEEEAVQRSFRLMRLLCGGTSVADELLESRAEDMTKLLFNVFNSRFKGSIYHACSVLQRLIQVQPDAVARAVSSDSQRYIGSMLLYLHHAPVADTLVQLVLLNHLASSQGGAGPSASMNGGGMSPYSGLGGMGGMFGGFGGSFGVRSSSVTSYDGSMTMYSSRGTAPAPPSRALLWRSLAGWGFLSVLAAHVFRTDYAAVPDHVQSASDALIQLLKALAAEEKAELLLSPLLRSAAVWRGFVQGACWPLAGVDYPRSGRWLRHMDAEDSYMQDHTVPTRQRECTRVLLEVTVLVHSPSVPAPLDGAAAGGYGGAMAAMQRMVDNVAAKHARGIIRALVAAVPQFAYALTRVQHALQPELVLHKTSHKAHKHGSAPKALVSVTPSPANADASAAVTPSAESSASGAAKKRRKKKKAGSSAATQARSPGSAETPEDHDDGGDDAPEPATTAPATPSAPAGDASSTITPARSSINSVSSTSIVAAAASAPRAAAPEYRHPGHVYAAPFGMFRLHAVQLLAILLRSELQVAAPEPLPPPSHAILADDVTSGQPSSRSRLDSAGELDVDANGRDSDSDAHRKTSKGGKGGKGKAGKHRAKGKGHKAHKPKTRDAIALVLKDDDDDDDDGQPRVAAYAAAMEAVSNSWSLLPVMPSSVEHELRMAWWRSRQPPLELAGRSVSDASSITVDSPAATTVQAQQQLARVPSGTAASTVSTEGGAAGSDIVQLQPPLPGAVYDPAEFWCSLTHWVVAYSHTNLFHIAFTAIAQSLLRHNHEASLRHMLNSARLLTTFIRHYEDTTPQLEGSSAAAAAAARKAQSRNASAARGTVLRICNMLRLAAQAQPPTALLPAHLRDHALWATFQPRLRSDSEIMLRPLVPPPSRNVAGGPSGEASMLGGMIGNQFSNLLSSGFFSGIGKKAEPSAKKAEDGEIDWNLGSTFAKELGFDAVPRYADPSVASSAASAVRKGATALAGKLGAAAKRAHGGSPDGAQRGSDSTDEASVEELLAGLSLGDSGAAKAGKGGKGGKKPATATPPGRTSPAPAASPAPGNALNAVRHSIDMLDVD